jgi:energy-converting hydrogenase Eha subunit F
MRYGIVVTTARKPSSNLPLYEVNAGGLPVFVIGRRGQLMLRIIATVVVLTAFVVYGHAGEKSQAASKPVPKQQVDAKGQAPLKVQSITTVEIVQDGKIKWRRPKFRIASCPCPE